MGETRTSHFYDFGIFEPVTKPLNQLHIFIFAEPRTPNKNQEETLKHFNKYSLYKSRDLKIPCFDIFRKDRHRKMIKTCLNKSPKSWICGSRVWVCGLGVGIVMTY